MDIQYLLWLQDLRNATGGVLDEFFNALSKFAVDIMPFLPFVIFWSADKKWGYRFITTWGLGDFAIMFAWKEWFAPATIVAAFGGHWGNLVARLLMVLFAMIVWPVVIKRECGKLSSGTS